MNLVIELGQTSDIDEIEQLYHDLNDHLALGVNYPGWKKGVYPVRQHAATGIKQGNLYVAKLDGKIVGSIILNHVPELAYDEAKWGVEADYSDVFVIHTFVIHPNNLRCGIGRVLMEFTIEFSRKLHAKAIRLDVYERNLPAISLYEQCGFQYIDTVDLGLSQYGLDWFKLYEKVL